MIRTIQIKYNYRAALLYFLFFLAFTAYYMFIMSITILHQYYPYALAIPYVDYVHKIKGPFAFFVVAFLCIAFFAVLLVLLFLFGSIIFKKDTYAIIASQKGLLLDRYGLLPWKNIDIIDSVFYYSRSGKPEHTYLVIHLKDMHHVRQEASLLIKVQLFIFSLTGKNRILINFLAEDAVTVARRLSNYMILMHTYDQK